MRKFTVALGVLFCAHVACPPAGAFDFYRKYNPPRPPLLLSLPPVVTGIPALPYVDGDADPPGTVLVLYRFEPLAVPVMAVRQGAAVAFDEVAATGACCQPFGCSDLPAELCTDVFDFYAGDGTSCGDPTSLCRPGACCEWAIPGDSCFTARNIAACHLDGHSFVVDEHCTDEGGSIVCGACCDAGRCSGSNNVYCAGTFVPGVSCADLGGC